MNKTFISLFLISFSLLCHSQNTVHVAYDTNGEVEQKLFPEDEYGQVVFSGIVPMDGQPVDILETAMEYMTYKKMTLNLDIKETTQTLKSVIYEVQCPIGKEYFGFEFWGSTVFSRYRDASKVSFTCRFAAVNEGLKYTLTNFWVERNLIKGEAKNDGSPNVIHWQRVNSLKKERDMFVAENNLKYRSNREELYEYNQRIKYEEELYKKEYAAVESLVNGLLILKVGEDVEIDSPIVQKKAERIDLSNYSGHLMARGNNIYITSSRKPYEEAAVRELIKQISIDSLWNVVYTPEEAHFILEYHVNTEGRDKAYFILKDYTGEREIMGKTYYTSEAISENIDIARDIYDVLFSCVIKLEKGKVPKDLMIFEINK